MPWTPLIDSEICAIHAALVPTANGDGEIIYFGGDEHSPPELQAGHLDKSRRFNCRTNAVTYVASPPADLFCCGHSLMADGRLLVGGGTKTYEAEAPGDHHGVHFTGERRCWAYNPFAPGFSEIARFGPAPAQEADDTGGGRWYPSIVTLHNGQLLAVAGHPSGDDLRHSNTTPERYLPATNSWTRLPELDTDWFPRLHVLPADGTVFFVAGGGQSFRYHPWTGERTVVSSAPGGLYGSGWAASSVMLPLSPEDNYRARILMTGDVQPMKIDLGAATPAWVNAGTRTGSAAGKLRNNAGAVLLPTGKVLVVGGVETGADTSAVLEPELYDPATDAWQTLAEPAAQPRNYHSTYLLMPDGRVWTSGSNVDGARTEGGVERRVRNIEIFNPPYPAGARPTIAACPGNVAYGQRFTVSSPQTEHIQRVALMRCGSMTHAFDFDQRCVILEIASRDGNNIEVIAPPHGAVAPPGYYMLFLIDDAGRPCERAHFVRVGGEMYVITDRSHFSEVEVDSMITASGSPATFYDSFYVVLDGFLAADVGLPAGPTVSFAWASGGAAPNMNARLEEALFEAGSASPGVGQRIVLRYSVRFPSDSAFATFTATEQRAVSVIVRSGPHEARGTFVLFKRKNPFMIDGNPHWLSVDLRVLQIPADQPFLGVPQGSDATAPFDFLDGVLTELRARPEGPMHPFDNDTLKKEQAASPLELSSHVNGKRVFNYAFARVHYRAPMGQNADNVRVFFRAFTTAAASLDYRPGTYPVHPVGSAATPLIGLAGDEVASIPFFARPREADLRNQTDPQNTRTLAGTGNEEYEYFGCWLDFNQPEGRYREHPTADGTGGTGDLLSLQEHIRGQHQCLVAEIWFPEDSIPWGATPGDNDNLAQRNLMVVESDNPGGGPGHRVQHTFELRPSDVWSLPMALGQIGGAAFAFNEFKRGQARPDQLLIRWNNLPRDSVATIYWPDVDMREVVEMASVRPSAGSLRLVDAHTLECKVTDFTLLPIPGNRATNIPGLISIQLPDSVAKGQLFRVFVHQISGTSNKVTGAFQFTIPVSLGPLLLEAEERKLSVLRHIALAIRPGNRWAAVFARYLDEIAARVQSFGGDPTRIAPSPAGTGRVPDEDFDCRPVEGTWTGRVVEIVYDRFGHFDGFVLRTCGHKACGCWRWLWPCCWKCRRRAFTTRDKTIEELVLRACRERVVLTVHEHPVGSKRPHSIYWHCC